MREPTRRPASSARRRRSRRRRVAVVVVVAVVLATLVGGGVALAAGRSDEDRYRTARASLGTVTQRVDAVGTVASAARRDAAFAVAGTVKKVDVKVGDTVDAGDTLATLDKTDLQDDVDSAKADLADAEQQLQDDLDSQTSTSTTSSTTTSTTTSTAGSSSTTATASSSTQAATVSDGVLRTSATPTISSAVYTTTSAATTRTVATTRTAATTRTVATTPSDDVGTALAAVQKAQDALLAQYTAVTKQLTTSGDAVDSEAAACKTFLAVTDISQASSTGDVLTVTPGTAAAGSAVKVTASGVSGTDPVQITLRSTGKVLAEVTPDGGSFTVGVVIPSGAGSGDDALQLVSGGTAVSSTAVTITAAEDSTVADALATCQQAIDDTLDAQQDVSSGQSKLMDLAKDLDDAVTALTTAVDAASTDDGSTPTPTPTPTPSQSATSSGGGKGGAPADDGTTGTPGGKDSGTDGKGGTGTGAPGTDGGTGTPGTGTPGTGTPGTGTNGTGNQGTGGTGTGGTAAQGTTKAASAADIVADRAAIDVAEQTLAIAKSKLELVTLTSPISGKVAAVDLAKGDAVSTASSTAVITVVGGTGYTVSTTVPLGSIDVVKVGQSADVTVRSTDEKLTGTVSSIGVTNVSTTSSTPSYAVDLEVDTDTQLYDGSSAQVRIEVAGGAQVLTVPTSAVHMDGSQASVKVLSGDSVTSVDVERGAVGSELTEITKGLTEGQKVVLADLKEPMKSGDDSSSGGLSGLGGSSDQQRGVGGQSFQGGPPGSFSGGSFSGGSGNRH